MNQLMSQLHVPPQTYEQKVGLAGILAAIAGVIVVGLGMAVWQSTPIWILGLVVAVAGFASFWYAPRLAEKLTAAQQPKQETPSESK